MRWGKMSIMEKRIKSQILPGVYPVFYSRDLAN